MSVKRGRVKVWLLQRPPLTVTVNNVWHMLGCSEGTSKINLYNVWHMPGCAEGTLHAADSGSRFWPHLSPAAWADLPGHGLWPAAHWKWCLQVSLVFWQEHTHAHSFLGANIISIKTGIYVFHCGIWGDAGITGIAVISVLHSLIIHLYNSYWLSRW